MKNVDDLHGYNARYKNAYNKIERLETSDRNKETIKTFVKACRRQGLAKSTITNYMNLIFRMIKNLSETGYTGDLDKIDPETFDDLLIYLEDECGVSQGEVRNYKKLIKKFFRIMCDDEDKIPKWVNRLKLGTVETQVQPSDIHTEEEIRKILNACGNARNEAMVAVLFDGGFRIGALSSCRIKHVERTKYTTILYISNSSKCKKTATAKGIPLTWSAPYLDQWLRIHPLKEDPEAPLWVTLNKNAQPLSYNTIRETLKNIGKQAGVAKPMNPHSFRHTAITTWILDGLNDQSIKHRASWAKSSSQMYKIYGNFTDQQINDQILETYGIKPSEDKQKMMSRCPRCENIVKQHDKVCPKCNLVFEFGLLEKLKEYESKVQQMLNLVAMSSAGRELWAQTVEMQG